jgi:uracil-DNA glycosylase
MLADVAQEALACRRCPLYRDATQVVLGAGDARAKLFLVGEQPGDREDLAGRPFVGPAGRCWTRRSRSPESRARPST